MNIIISFLLFFLLTFQVHANTIYNLIKIPNLEIYETNTPNKLRYLYAKQPFTIGIDNNINCYNSEKKVLDKKYKIIKKNLDKYDQKFLKKINLKYIVLCEDLSISKINTAGIPDNVMKTLILDVKFNERYFERVIHHEIFHIIESNFKMFFPDIVWNKFNNPDFNYSDGSLSPEAYSLMKLSHTNGFFSEYSKYSISEDMAETFSFINSREKYVSEVINLDKILNKKVIFIKEGMSNIEKSL